jgi:large subunit ribosomal protein L21
MYCVVKIGAHQETVKPGMVLRVPLREGEPGQVVDLGEVLLWAEEDTVLVGHPVVENASVKAKIMDHGQAAKVTIWKFHKRKNYRRHKGHRQRFTEVKVVEIIINGKSYTKAEAVKPAAVKKPVRKAKKAAAVPVAPAESPAPVMDQGSEG